MPCFVSCFFSLGDVYLLVRDRRERLDPVCQVEVDGISTDGAPIFRVSAHAKDHVVGDLLYLLPLRLAETERG